MSTLFEPFPPDSYLDPAELHELPAPAHYETPPLELESSPYTISPHKDVGSDEGAEAEEAEEKVTNDAEIADSPPVPALAAGTMAVEQAAVVFEPTAEPTIAPAAPASEVRQSQESTSEAQPELLAPESEQPQESAEVQEPAEPPVERAGGSPPIDIPPETPPPAAGEPEEPEGPSESENPYEHEDPEQFEVIKLPSGSRAAIIKTITEEIHNEHVQDLIAKENAGLEWPTSDSPLEGEHQDAMEQTFNGTIPPGRGNLREFVEREMRDNPNKVAIEVGGSGSKMFAGFTEGTFEKTYGVNLTDPRKRAANSEELIAEDVARGHTVIPGNLMSDEVHRQIETELGDQKAGLIVERMVGGLDALPGNPITMAQEAARWYKHLAPGGSLFAEVPHALRAYTQEWKEMIDRDYPGLEVDRQPLLTTSVIRITKREGAPDELPLLSARRVLEVERYDAINDDDEEWG